MEFVVNERYLCISLLFRLWSGVWDNLTPNRALFNAQLGSHLN